MPSSETLYRSITASLQNLIDEKVNLINSSASEWAIVHRFAVYLEKEFKFYDVDCEYNLNIDNPKRLLDNLIRPDVLVHKRKTHENNLIAIEFRKKKRGRGKLQERLENFKRVYGYKYVEYILIPNKVNNVNDFQRVIIK